MSMKRCTDELKIEDERRGDRRHLDSPEEGADRTCTVRLA